MPQIVETANIRAVKNAVRRTVAENGLMAVVAEVGSGKTTMFNYLAQWWESNPDKFRLIKIKSFDSRYTKIGIIMRFMLETLSPQSKVPSGNERRYEELAVLLRRYAQKRFKIILMIDEAQDMRLQTFLDIKKIHEIACEDKEHLFSVILLGKSASKKWHALLDSPELGYRMDVTFMEPLIEEDLVKIAEEKYLIRFENTALRKRFCNSLAYKTPLGVEYFAKAVRRELGIASDEQADVTPELLLRIPMLTQKLQLRQAGVTQAELADYCRKVSASRKYNSQRISEYLNGKLSPEDAMHQELYAMTEQFIANAYNKAKLNIRR